MHFWELCRAGKEVIVRAASVRRADEIRAWWSAVGQLSRLQHRRWDDKLEKALICGPIVAGRAGEQRAWQNPGGLALLGLTVRLAWGKGVSRGFQRE